MSDEPGLFDVMYTCRAMRRLAPREVPEDLLVKLIDAANQAPSGSNLQNAGWIVVRDSDVRQQLADLNRASVTAYLAGERGRSDGLPHQTAAKRKRMLDAVEWQSEHMHEIPALIVACMDFGVPVNDMMIGHGGGSVWPGVQNLLLAARALGLGAAPTTLALVNRQAVAKVLGLPETMAAYCLIPVGYPIGNFGPVKRKPLSDVMRFDRWQSS